MTLTNVALHVLAFIGAEGVVVVVVLSVLVVSALVGVLDLMPKGLSGTFVHGFHWYCFIVAGGSCSFSRMRVLNEYLGLCLGISLRGEAGLVLMVSS